MNYSQEEFEIANRTIALFDKDKPLLEDVIKLQRQGRGNDFKDQIVKLHNVAEKETNYPYVFTPLDLCQTVLNKIEEYSTIEGDVLIIENIEYVGKLIAGIRRGEYANIGLIHYISFSRKKIEWVENRYDKYGIVYTHKFGYTKDKKGKVLELTFGDIDMSSIDFIISNPPYSQKKSSKKKEIDVNDLENGGESNYKKSVDIWEKIVEQSFNYSKEDGYMAMIHPNDWRDASNRNKLWDKMTRYDIKYLEIHSVNDGLSVFNAQTKYDWYVLQKTENDASNQTLIRDIDGIENKVNLREWNWLPNGRFDFIKSLIAKDGEEKVEIIYDRTAYGSDKKNMSPTQTDEHIYPCVNYLGKNGRTTLYWSNTNQNGHFGVPKLIFTWGDVRSTGFLVDTQGEYGLTQGARAIVDDVNNLENIKKALESDKFREMAKYLEITKTELNRYILSEFRKDFWKEFV